MKIIQLLLINAILVGVSVPCLAQVQQQSQKKTTKIDVFTPHEKDQIQIWLHDQTAPLKLTENQLAEYSNVILTNFNAIFHLTDSDKNYSLKEIDEKTVNIFKKINKQTKPIMNAEQYRAHELTMKRFEAAYMNRLYNPSEETNLYSYLKEKGEIEDTEE